ncbi:MAG TPA: FAD-dependent oxidoreductase [Oculatellaceae cyanobacterium]
MPQTGMPLTIVILGGGFAGIKCAKTLSKLLQGSPHKIVVFNRENHMVFHPLLAEVASAAVQPQDVGAPLRQLLKDAECRTEEVLGIDLEEQTVEYEAHNGERRLMKYHQLVVACGSESNMAVVPGMGDHAFGLKTIGDALALQSHIMEQLEKAEVCEDITQKQRYLSFVVVGGGFSGVEVAGEINGLVRRSLKFFKHISREDVRVTIVHSRDRLLPEVSPSLGDFALRKMRQSGLQILLNVQVIRATSQGVVLKDGKHISAGTIVCTIGTSIAPIVQRMAAAKERGRLVVNADMSLPEHPNVWAIGDCANIINAVTKSPSPPVAQFAERQGTQVAHNIFARLADKETKPFSFKMLGSLCSIGGHDAVAEIMGAQISGFPAWFLWRGIYLMKLPSLPQQIKVGIEWAFDLIFPRTLAHLKTDRSKKVTRAYFAAGDWVFREHDPATDFYMIEAGEIEIVKGGDAGEVVAILGVGDFFGEGALLDARARNASVRARTDVELVVMGSSVFAEISGALAPLKESLASAMKRRRNIWTNLDNIRTVLEAIPLSLVTDALPGAPLPPDASVFEAIERMNKHRLDFCVVVDREQNLLGIITRADLLQAIEVASSLSKDQQLDISVKSIMVKDPVAISAGDTTLLAFTTMRERGMTSLLIVEGGSHRRVQGYVRLENVMDEVVQRSTGVVRPKVSSRSALTKEISL